MEFNYYGNGILIKGDTKDNKDELKSLGGRWNRSLGGWIFSKEKEFDLLKLSIPCLTDYKKLSKTDIQNIKVVCNKLDYERFSKLPDLVKCLFYNYSYLVYSNKDSFKDDQVNNAINILMYGKRLNDKIFQSYVKSRFLSKLGVQEEESEEETDDESEEEPKKPVKSVKVKSKSASKSKSSTSKSRTPAKKYDKEGQRYASPENTDATYVFYTSMYEEDENSPLSITWLTEHGVFEGKKREKLLKKYKTLLEKGKLIK